MTEVLEGTPLAQDMNDYGDYWGVDEKHKFTFPDGKSWIEFQIMDEGAKSRFQKLTNQDLTIGKNNEAKVRLDPANERHTLIKESVTDWLMFKRNAQTGAMEPVAFSKQLLAKWLEVAPPKVVEDLEYEIRMKNPWMQSEMTIEAIDEQIDRLQETRRQIIDREAGEESSANK
jgi:hypothetical protein